MPRGRISKLGIKRGDPRVTFVVPQARWNVLKGEADAAKVTVSELCRTRALGAPLGSEMCPPNSARELTVEYDGEASR